MTYTKDSISFQPKPTHPRFVDIEGQKFHRLYVLGFAGVHKNTRSYWWCRCDCQKIVIIDVSKLRNGHTKSCGCYKAEIYRGYRRTHGMTKTITYKSFDGMKQRCLNPQDEHYPNYGGRGITVCDRWRNSFENFLADMGERPSKQHSIERKDNNGNYEPDNCKWATATEQSNNRRSSRLLTYNGKTQSLALWCRELHLRRDSVNYSLKLGRSVADAFHHASK